MWEYRHTDELYHYGRKGMKWGQHIFGKIKDAIDNSKTKRAEAKAEKQKAEEERIKRNRPASQLSDSELRERKARLQLEKEYLDLQQQVARLTPQKTNEGRDFVSKFMKEAVQPSLVSAGKKLLENVFDTQVKKLTGTPNASDSAKRALDEATKDLRKLRDTETADRYRGYVSRGTITDAELQDEVLRTNRWKTVLGVPDKKD